MTAHFPALVQALLWKVAGLMGPNLQIKCLSICRDMQDQSKY